LERRVGIKHLVPFQRHTDRMSDRRTGRVLDGSHCHDGIDTTRWIRDWVRNERTVYPAQQGDTNGHVKGEGSSCLGHARGAKQETLSHSSRISLNGEESDIP
jgi:hypothetical protein